MDRISSNYDKAYEKVNRIFLNRFHINIDQKDATFLDKQLLGYDWGFNARDLLYLYFDLEKECNIKIPQEFIIQGKFKTINNIIELLCEVYEREAV